MLREALAQFPYVTLALVGQLIFFAVFIGVIGWAFRKGSTPFYDHLANLPLEEGKNKHE